jgi:hypothetical protein
MKQPNELISDVMRHVNLQLNGGHCPGKGSLGECPMVDLVQEPPPGGDLCWFHAAIYIWSAGQTLTPTEVAKWFEEAGAHEITISHDIYDPWNNNFNGVCEDGAIPWIVNFANRACNVITADVSGEKS